MRVLLRMKHGLGDNAQFTIVTRHIKHYFPDWSVDMEVGRGKESYFKDFAKNIFLRKQDKYNYKEYDNLLDVDWPTPEFCNTNLPSSKPTRFLKKYLHVEPIEELYKGYNVTITKEEEDLANNYISTLPKPFVIVHYIAKTLKHAKSLTHKDARFICKKIIHFGYTPVVLDWKNESPLPNNKTIFNPDVDNPIWKGEKLSSAGTIAALISKAKLYVGVDSGPLHTAGCTKTPTLGIWHGHHPVNFYDLCDNVTHLVPIKAKKLRTIKGKQKKRAKDYFERSYKHIYYYNLRNAISKELEKRLQ